MTMYKVDRFFSPLNQAAFQQLLHDLEAVSLKTLLAIKDALREHPGLSAHELEQKFGTTLHLAQYARQGHLIRQLLPHSTSSYAYYLPGDEKPETAAQTTMLDRLRPY